MLWLDQEHKHPTIKNIESIIYTELLDKHIESIGYESIVKFMMHSSCGHQKPKSPYKVKGQCSKHFSKKFWSQTSINQNGFAIYTRKDNEWYGIKNEVILDNRFVVLYNLDLVIHYQTHINIEWYNK